MAQLNGVEDHPDQLPGIALIGSEPLGPARPQDGHSVLLSVRVHAVHGVDAATRQFPPRHAGSLDWLLPTTPDPYRTVVTAEAGPLRYIEWSVQSDFGAWAVLQRTKRRSATLVLAGQWGSHDSGVAIGHRPLRPDEWAAAERLGALG
ncbi:hypothetical protein AB0G04_40835 [Actinoplanes sp. NPDC023801]|uniref:hypothetical protein n=1 Tax=Actinoplanes sp. NPDC023801 TaxID=3154595 RepID=UPI0033EB7403